MLAAIDFDIDCSEVPGVRFKAIDRHSVQFEYCRCAEPEASRLDGGPYEFLNPVVLQKAV